MKNLFLTLIILVSGMAQAQSFETMISQDPVTNLDRKVEVVAASWGIEQGSFAILMRVHSLDSNGDEINRLQQVKNGVAGLKCVDTTGADLPCNDANAVNEYDFLMNKIDSGELTINQMIMQQVVKLDSEGFFDQ